MNIPEKNILVKKWIDGSITEEELNVFKTFDDFEDYAYIANNAAHFKSPSFREDETYATIRKKIESEKTKSVNRLRAIFAVAATVAILFGSYFTFFKTYNTIITADSNQMAYTLPDNSEVLLTKNSTITFNEDSWETERNLSLTGEAFFKVSKGSMFSVKTENASVSVLGTQFNVDAKNNLKVSCYEGKVLVKTKGSEQILTAGLEFSPEISDTAYPIFIDAPMWVSNAFIFKSKPLDKIVTAIEIHYGKTIVMDKNIDGNRLFTGKINSNNLKISLEELTIPLNLQFEIQENSVIIKK